LLLERKLAGRTETFEKEKTLPMKEASYNLESLMHGTNFSANGENDTGLLVVMTQQD